MKKLFKYTLNTILFLIFWCLQMVVIIYLTVERYGHLRSNGLAAIGGIMTLFISYRLVKNINISKRFPRTKEDIKLEKEIDNITAEKKLLIMKKPLSILKKYYKIISLVIILVSTGVTIFLFSNDSIPKSINSPDDPFEWEWDYYPSSKSSLITMSNDSLYYRRSSMTLFTGRISDNINYFSAFETDGSYKETYLNGFNIK